MTSNWFRPRRPSAGAQDRAAGEQARAPGGMPGQLPRQPNGGQRPGEWQPFERAPEPVGGGTTNAGLPVRVPQANRLPSGARPGYEPQTQETVAESANMTGQRRLAAPPAQARSAETARTRLRGFQHGSRRAEARLPPEGERAGR